ncbi:hypothetical protein NCS57_01279500 [Fusarium keratoplasticum]|uniref:Uncharacterized protein n=1 Tax=Fusarium keratoplasticum TaxID=1328300 RepID=A0ACC0QIG0_9HYPO|nr:hypothetical protein NCS57_01279500 [Fusarium keratoplasticum]KAI8655309.1 hypothetical protein NCS57_01279500 [Fusarium keratoplasticum]KAI8656141.1 hypothetical protein NCS55_01268800 [Fusarium keratoplasticum]
MAGIIFKAKTEFVSQSMKQLEESSITVVSGGTGLTRPDEGKFLQMGKAAEALAREQEELADKQVERRFPKPEIKCAGCGSKTHELLTCLKAAPNGLMKGCPECNTIQHNVDGCPKLKRDLNLRFWFLVQRRGRMPAFATENPDFHWASVYRQWMAEEDSLGRRRSREPMFPWTPEFTQQLIEAQIQHYQERLDKDRPTPPARPPGPQAEQIQEVGTQVQAVVNNNPAALVPGAAAVAAVAQGPFTDVDIDDFIADIIADNIENDGPAVEPDSAEDTKGSEITDTEEGSGEESGGEKSDGESNQGDDEIDWTL